MSDFLEDHMAGLHQKEIVGILGNDDINDDYIRELTTTCPPPTRPDR
jgi:hypothetical protein